MKLSRRLFFADCFGLLRCPLLNTLGGRDSQITACQAIMVLHARGRYSRSVAHHPGSHSRTSSSVSACSFQAYCWSKVIFEGMKRDEPHQVWRSPKLQKCCRYLKCTCSGTSAQDSTDMRCSKNCSATLLGHFEPAKHREETCDGACVDRESHEP